ncbi:hypothetical protein HHX47_DHR7000674 [Lentinula edodes]|nr:hypothetical protein HHX47_DHR7000674 [Lentinula edodes]
MSSPPTPEQVAQASITLADRFLHWGLFGAFFTQLFYVTILIQLSAIFFITHTIWGTLVLNFGVVAVVTHVPWSVPLALLTTGICSLFSYRHITGSNVLFLAHIHSQRRSD